MSDFDNPWKEVLEHFFRHFLAYFFPEAYAVIDWSRGYESLDKELQQIVSEAELGPRLADNLFKVWLKDGRELWVLIHVEIQNQRDPHFAERMFVYNYRIYDRHRRPVVSLAVLGDEERNWRPNQFGYNLLGCNMGMQFPVVKLLDYAAKEEQLEADANPFAAAVLAHLKTQETRDDPVARRVCKFRLIKSLYERALDGEQIRLLFKIIDWMMVLPAELDRVLKLGLAEFEKERKMPYVSSIERIAREEGKAEGKAEGLAEGKAEGLAEGKAEGLAEGKAEGLAEGKAEGLAEGKAVVLLRLLTKRFTKVPADVESAIRATTGLAKLDEWIDAGLDAATLVDFRRLAGI